MTTRNAFNKPLVVAASMFALGGAPEAAQAEAAPPSATYEQFKQCLRPTEPSGSYVFSQEHFWGATASRVGRLAAELTEADPVIVGRDHTRARFNLQARQTGDISRPDDSECGGEGFLRGVLIIRAGSAEQGEPSRSRVLHRSLVDIVYDNGMLDAGQPAHDQARGTFPFARFCKLDPNNTRLDLRATAGYYEPGVAGGVERYHNSWRLPCPEPLGANQRHHGNRQDEPAAHASLAN